jgi:hypothetical protein
MYSHAAPLGASGAFGEPALLRTRCRRVLCVVLHRRTRAAACALSRCRRRVLTAAATAALCVHVLRCLQTCRTPPRRPRRAAAAAAARRCRHFSWRRRQRACATKGGAQN